MRELNNYMWNRPIFYADSEYSPLCGEFITKQCVKLVYQNNRFSFQIIISCDVGGLNKLRGTLFSVYHSLIRGPMYLLAGSACIECALGYRESRPIKFKCRCCSARTLNLITVISSLITAPSSVFGRSILYTVGDYEYKSFQPDPNICPVGLSVPSYPARG